MSWLHQFRPLRVRFECKNNIHQALLQRGDTFVLLPILNHVFCEGFFDLLT
jgi:hypothetical protein